MSIIAPARSNSATAATPAPAVHIRGAALLFTDATGASRGLHPTDLTIAPGEFVALLGPNGSGKSTLIRLIAGVARHDRGEIQRLGEPISGRGADRLTRARLGVVFQSLSLDPLLTIRENLEVFASLFGMRRAERDRQIAHLAGVFEIDDRLDHRVRTLSGGLARRADLCRALLPSPELLLLDEPSAGLDLRARRTLITMISALRHDRPDRPLTIVLATHHMDEAEAAQRVVMMHEGRVVADAAPEALRTSMGAQIMTCQDTDDARRTLESAGIGLRPGSPGRLILESPDTPPASIAARCLDLGVSFSVAPPTLADVYLDRTGARLAAREDANP